MPLNQLQTARLKQVMISQLGKGYLFGCKPSPSDLNPFEFDCSGLVHWCYAQLGLTVPEGSEDQFEASVHIDTPVIGDLAFFRADGSSTTHHVGMLFDDSSVIEARGSPYNRVINRPREKWEAWHEFVGWNRFKLLA